MKIGINSVTRKSELPTYVKTKQTFEDKYPGVWPGVNRFEVTDANNNIIELWIRINGVMRDVTEKYLLEKEIERLECDTDG